MQHPHNDADRSAYYRKQASACATAALSVAAAEVRQAYLDLEQGWLCLAPKVAESAIVLASPDAANSADPPQSREPASDASHDRTD